MTDFLSNKEIHEQVLELVEENDPHELLDMAQRERVLCKINTEIIGFELKFKVGHNAHALVDPKRNEITTITHDHEKNSISIDASEEMVEENSEVLNTFDRLQASLRQSFMHHKGDHE